MESGNKFKKNNANIAWCKGCGLFPSLRIIEEALNELDCSNLQTVLVSGIGQSAKLPQYIEANSFCGLHGRAIPAAAGMKAANKNLKVIVSSGDSDIYSEGGNHFIQNIRRNPDITVLVGDNMVLGLTKGQPSPTSEYDFETKNTNYINDSEPLNPLALAISQDVGFCARIFCADIEKSKDIIKKAVMFNGFSFVDILQPCVVFNNVNTYTWFKDNTYYLEDDYEPYERCAAFKRAIESEKLALGIFYIRQKPTFEENEKNVLKTRRPLYKHRVDIEKLKEIMQKRK